MTVPLMIFASVGVLLILLLVALYMQYRKHKKPLLVIDPDVHYSFGHHLKMVTIPTLRYRMSNLRVQKKVSPSLPSNDDTAAQP